MKSLSSSLIPKRFFTNELLECISDSGINKKVDFKLCFDDRDNMFIKTDLGTLYIVPNTFFSFGREMIFLENCGLINSIDLKRGTNYDSRKELIMKNVIDRIYKIKKGQC